MTAVELSRAPLFDEAVRLVDDGATEISFPFVDEHFVAAYAAELAAARDWLNRHGVEFAVLGLEDDA